MQGFQGFYNHLIVTPKMLFQLRFLLFSLVVVVVASHVLEKREADGFEQIVDEMIYEVTKEIKDKHEEEVGLPDIDETIEKKWKWGLKLRGELTGKGGWIKDVSTLKRSGPLEYKMEGENTILGITLGLEDLEFGFKEYSAEIFHIGVHGKISVTVGKNAIYAHLNMHIPEKGDCKTTVDKIEITKLDDIHVDMTGLGRDADWIYSFVVQFLANKYHDKIAKSVSDKLHPVITQALAKNDICKKFIL